MEERIHEQLDAMKTDWNKTREAARAARDLGVNLVLWTILEAIACLGIQLTETDQRLIEVEKAIKELKAGLK